MVMGILITLYLIFVLEELGNNYKELKTTWWQGMSDYYHNATSFKHYWVLFICTIKSIALLAWYLIASPYYVIKGAIHKKDTGADAFFKASKRIYIHPHYSNNPYFYQLISKLIRLHSLEYSPIIEIFKYKNIISFGFRFVLGSKYETSAVTFKFYKTVISFSLFFRTKLDNPRAFRIEVRNDNAFDIEWAFWFDFNYDQEREKGTNYYKNLSQAILGRKLYTEYTWSTDRNIYFSVNGELCVMNEIKVYIVKTFRSRIPFSLHNEEYQRVSFRIDNPPKFVGKWGDDDGIFALSTKIEKEEFEKIKKSDVDGVSRLEYLILNYYMESYKRHKKFTFKYHGRQKPKDISETINELMSAQEYDPTSTHSADSVNYLLSHLGGSHGKDQKH